jgi:hypothetical protein
MDRTNQTPYAKLNLTSRCVKRATATTPDSHATIDLFDTVTVERARIFW